MYSWRITIGFGLLLVFYAIDGRGQTPPNSELVQVRKEIEQLKQEQPVSPGSQQANEHLQETE